MVSKNTITGFVGFVIGFIISSIIFFKSLSQIKADLISLLSSNLAIAVATIFYVALTYFLLSESIKMRKVQTEPEISLTIQPEKHYAHYFDMIIENIGLGSARNVHFEVLTDLKLELKEKPEMLVSDIGYIKHGIKYIAPKQKFTFFLRDDSNFDKLKDKQLKIKVKYEDKNNNPKAHTFEIPFSQFEELIFPVKHPIYAIADDINKIRIKIAGDQK